MNIFVPYLGKRDRNSNWTDADDGILRERWAAGDSAGTIARQLNRSRNSVIGRKARLKLEARVERGGKVMINRLPYGSKPIRPQRPPQIIVERPPMAFLKCTEVVPEPTIGHVDGITLMELWPTDCRWPVNDPPKGGEYMFCGAKQADNSSYCAEHHKRAFYPSARKVG